MTPKAINVDLFNVEVAVWRTDKQRRKFLRSHGVKIERHNDACFSSAHMDVGPDGVAWFSMVIKDGATMATLAHECVHIADWLMDRFGIPTDVTNTEIRGYIVGHLFAGLRGMFGETV